MSPPTSPRCARRRIAKSARWMLSTALLATVVAAPSADATHGKLAPPPYPKISSCSSDQAAYLKSAWWEAYRYVHDADQLLDYIAAAPAADRAELWRRDNGAGQVPSPRRYFGTYTADRLGDVRRATERARGRFANRGIRKIACHEWCAEDPSAYHAAVGKIVTCPVFWRDARDPKVDAEARLSTAARRLVHETFHWLRADAEYVTDLHGGGTKKYYGMDNVTYLAENKPSWATHNNDSYAYFTRAVNKAAAPTFSGVFADKETGGSGALYREMTWSGLQARIAELGPGQYLADVETYLRDGERRYSGLWRIGTGGGTVHAMPLSQFHADHATRRNTEDLIDVEVYRDGGKTMALGVYRAKTASGVGGLLVDLTWAGLAAKQQEYAANAYLADFETYLVNGERRWVGVWRVGTGTGALIRHHDKEFRALKAGFDKTQQLIDYERYGDMLVGVWRAASQGRELSREHSASDFEKVWQSLWPTRTLIDIEEFSTLPAQVLK